MIANASNIKNMRNVHSIIIIWWDTFYRMAAAATTTIRIAEKYIRHEIQSQKSKNTFTLHALLLVILLRRKSNLGAHIYVEQCVWIWSVPTSLELVSTEWEKGSSDEKSDTVTAIAWWRNRRHQIVIGAVSFVYIHFVANGTASATLRQNRIYYAYAVRRIATTPVVVGMVEKAENRKKNNYVLNSTEK